MKLFITKLFTAFLFSGLLFFVMDTPASAQIPDIEGYVLVEGTNAPVVGVWVRLTNSASTHAPCPAGTINQSRYVQTDNTGKYTFISYTTDGSAVGIGVSIDTDLDGVNDAIKYPTIDSCDPTDTPGSIFACGHDPFVVDVIMPQGWTGTFDIYGTHDKNPCVFCINNGEFTVDVPSLYYHPTSSITPTLTPVLTSAITPTVTPTPTITPTPAASCDVNIVPNSYPPMVVGTSNTYSVFVNNEIPAGSIDQVKFLQDPAETPYVSISPSGLTAFPPEPAEFTVTGVLPGLAHLRAEAYSGGIKNCETPSGSEATATVVFANPWWQVQGDVVANGDIESFVPTTADTPQFITLGSSTTDYGVAQYFGNIATDPGDTWLDSIKGWHTNTRYTGKLYDFAHFEQKVPDTNHRYNLPDSELTTGDLVAGPTYHGYKVFYRDGGGSDLNINGNLDIGAKKIILYVKNANLNINGNINVNDGIGFFMAIVDKNIFVNSTVTELEGLYLADESIYTGAGSDQLKVRGSVISYAYLGDGVVFERDLLDDNDSLAGELFEYAPDQMLKFPAFLGIRTLKWLEVNP